jgi:hypothetical protein
MAAAATTATTADTIAAAAALANTVAMSKADAQAIAEVRADDFAEPEAAYTVAKMAEAVARADARQARALMRGAFARMHRERVAERPRAALFPTDTDELGIPVLLREYDRVTVAVAWHVSQESAAALAPRADALVAAMLAPTVDKYARADALDFVAGPVTWPAAGRPVAASATPYRDMLEGYARGGAPSMLGLMRQAWDTVQFCFAGQHVHNCVLVITDGHEEVLRDPLDEMALLMRAMAARNIHVVVLDVSAGAGAGAGSLARMAELFEGWGDAWFDVARAGFEGFVFARYSAMWMMRGAVCDARE